MDVLYSLFYLWRVKIGRVKYVFSGFSGHRVMWSDAFFNRYFDPIMDDIEEIYNEKAMIFEYEERTNKNYYKSKRVVELIKLIHYFKFKTKKVRIGFQKLIRFDELLTELQKETRIDTIQLQKRISATLNNCLAWKSLWLYVLKKTSAEYAFILCYYNNAMYGLILAAKQKGIKTIDMQHGGQGSFHPGYNYTKIPLKGFDLFPDYFWTWDETSARSLQRCMANTPHSVVIGGNPWIDYLKGQVVQLSKNKIILYTLQTTLTPVLPTYIIEAINATSNDYTWWLRLHPRMTKSEIAEFYQTLEKENMLNKVEVEKATELPLPVILANCVVHVSHSSGSVIEAVLLNVPVNIVMGNTGKKYFRDLLDNKLATYFEPEDKLSLFAFIQQQENAGGKKIANSMSEEPDYRTAFQTFQ